MTLYFRLLRVLINMLFNPKQGIKHAAVLKFKVWPWDCDINRHLNNARYLSFMDLGRVYLQGQIGLYKIAMQRKWVAVIHAIDITYIRPIAPWKTCELVTRLIGWDEKYIYLEQRFLVDDHTHAVALVRGLVIHGREKVPTADILALLGQDYKGPELPEVVKQWLVMKSIKKQIK